MALLAITESDLMDALANAFTGHAPEDARTVAQMAASSGLTGGYIQKGLRALHAAGRLRCHRVPIVGIDGRHCRVPGYTITPAATKSAAKPTRK